MMATKLITSDDMIAAARRLRRRGSKKVAQVANDVMTRDINDGINSFKNVTDDDVTTVIKGNVRIKKANDYLMVEIERLGKDIGAILDTYFPLGSRLNKGYNDSYGTDYTSNESLKKVVSDLLGAKDTLGDARDDMAAGKSIPTKDIENNADRVEDNMRSLIFGLQDDLNDVFNLASKIGNRDVINAIEVLNGYGEK